MTRPREPGSSRAFCISPRTSHGVHSDAARGLHLSNSIDYLILGGDSAGCVLAARLFEDAGKTVRLAVARRDISQATMHADVRSRYPGRVYLGRPCTVHTVRRATSAQPHRVYRHFEWPRSTR